MGNANEGQQAEHGRRGRDVPNDDDRAWAQRMADEREKRELVRQEELKELIGSQNRLTQNGVAKNGVMLEEVDTKLNALMERVETIDLNIGRVVTKVSKDEYVPTSAFGRWVYAMDAKLKRALPYVTVAGAAAAVGYGGYRGVKAVRDSMSKRVDLHADVRIQPVGEPIPMGDRDNR